MNNELKSFRNIIDELDAKLMSLLAQRMQVTRQVGQYKVDNDIALIDADREKRQIAKIGILADKCGLDKTFATRILREIINETVRNHGLLKKSGSLK